MKNKVCLFVFLFISVISIEIYAQNSSIINYFNLDPPGDTAIIFAPGIVSKIGRHEHAGLFSKDGNEFYFSETPDWIKLITYSMTYSGDSWSVEDTVSFSLNNPCSEPFFRDSSNIIFTDGKDFWITSRNESGWEAPILFDENVNTLSVQWHPTFSEDGTLYFSSSGNIYKSVPDKGNYSLPIKLSFPLNTSSTWDADAYISPDQDYIIFHSNRSDSYGDLDLYISYAKEDGNWTNPKNLGSDINTQKQEHGPYITPDRKYMLYSQRTSSETDIYWVSSNFISNLKTTNYTPYVKNTIPNLIDTIGEQFVYILPDTIFMDDDGIETLIISAEMSNGDDLPVWLEFDPEIKKFTGYLSEAGNFDIRVTATDADGAYVSDIFRLTVINTAVNIKIANAKDFHIYPIPAQDKIYIKNGIETKNTLYEIIDMNGKLIAKSELLNDFIDVSAIGNGIYILRIITPYLLLNEKIIIE